MRKIFVVLLFLLMVDIVSGIELVINTGIPFYKDGIGVLGGVGVRGSLDEVFKINLPIYLSAGLYSQYARGVDGEYFVDLVDVSLFVGGEYTYLIGNFGISGGVDLGFSYGNTFNISSNLGSLGLSIRPNVGGIYFVSKRLGFFGDVGYNVGLYNFYLGYVYFDLGIILGL